ncbi:chaperone NapD [Tropicibacter sp. Alg240-R139]|uniref:chaperone NapD n=1 Tax=Tropicibacter sp. Alg240-R139 TaxID=2305991 RepID=UPI0013DFAC6C|nr:chaperone NapD [Tropicibacter sp. Alg240-R139]
MMDEVHISSLLLRADPANLDAVCARVLTHDGAEVAMTDDTGKIIVTLETNSEAVIVAHMNSLSLLDGVVSVALVYHQKEQGL